MKNREAGRIGEHKEPMKNLLFSLAFALLVASTPTQRACAQQQCKAQYAYCDPAPGPFVQYPVPCCSGMQCVPIPPDRPDLPPPTTKPGQQHYCQ
jgi:hypothetical protein